METCLVGFTPEESVRLDHINFKNMLILMHITSQENFNLHVKISTCYDRKKK